jgi:hypothetical protein
MRGLVLGLGTAATLGAGLCSAAPLAAQERASDREFRWSEPVQAGAWMRIRNLNGEIHVEPASGNTAEVVAVKHGRGDPSSARVEVTRNGNDVLVCAIWEDVTEVCDEDDYRTERSGRRNRDGDHVAIDITVRLPRGVHVLAAGVNGEVEVRGATGEVVARSVNGRVEAVSSGGPVHASTVNGSIVARMATVPTGEDLEYSTVNGSVTLELPANFAAQVEMRTVNGSLRSDFPLQLQGRVNPRRIDATIGEGGSRRLKISTVNGSVELRKGSS